MNSNNDNFLPGLYNNNLSALIAVIEISSAVGLCVQLILIRLECTVSVVILFDFDYNLNRTDSFRKMNLFFVARVIII